MSRLATKLTIKYEGNLDPAFPAEIASNPGGEHLHRCIQCGTCSATCPLSIYMDYTPRRVIAMTRAGFRDEVLNSFTIWLCASCYSCTVECPKQIRITDIMYTLKQQAIKRRVYPRRFPIPVLAREFFKAVLRTGRNNESRLLSQLYLRTTPLRFLTKGFVGLRLWLKGRMKFGSETIRNRRELKAILDSIDRDRKSEVAKKVTVTTGTGL
ncbi:MAG: 4Fe-4S dicluster domain-containing protein [Candidatus Zixiibacteriota bacterium]